MRYFTAIGSRQTPTNILDQLFDICAKICAAGLVLRSGGADGADLASEKGCDFVGGQKEIYLPWRGFNNSSSPLYHVSKEALELASTIHPAWHACNHGARKLHGRNCYQVLGKDLNTPSSFVICWTKDGEKIGGTRTAIVIAEKYQIPVYNLAIFQNIDIILKHV